MGLYKYVREAWKQPKKNEFYKQRLIEWRKDFVTIRISRPTRIDRARSLGYRAKPGFIIIRQRVSRGKRQHPKKMYHGRRPKASSRVKNLDKSYMQVAEERSVQKYPNCEVLNSYPVGEDGKSFWFEVILVDRANPHILADSKINWICSKKGRAARGLTSAGKKSRGLRSNKGKGAEKLRPSRRANLNRRKKALKD
ncbi:MAG: 50S ribosomal protein L15e [Nanoarchaeota archaeon]|nr:50S ribosomal protein L15e [Nanoarchaeota archaeon]